MPAKYFTCAKPAVKKFPDGREVCDQTKAKGREEYSRRLGVMAQRQLHRCAMCLRVRIGLTFDHEAGRGHGGAHRDDRIWREDGSPQNAALCGQCNLAKGSKRFTWINGKYQQERMEA